MSIELGCNMSNNLFAINDAIQIHTEVQKYLKLEKNIFSNDFDPTTRDKIAACLIEVISDYSDIVWENRTVRLNIFKFFDDHLDKSNIYKALKIDKSKQTHEKFAILKTIKASFIQEINIEQKRFTSISAIIDKKSNILKIISKPQYKILFQTFIECEDFSKKLLQDLISEIRYLEDLLEIDKIDKYENIKKLLQNYIEYFKVFNNDYSILFLNMMNEILSLLSKLFENNDTYKNYILELNTFERKYPLNIQNAKFSLKLRILNKGPGTAFDVNLLVVDHDNSIRILNSNINIGTNN
jgi:uncharacterized protein